MLQQCALRLDSRTASQFSEIQEIDLYAETKVVLDGLADLALQSLSAKPQEQMALNLVNPFLIIVLYQVGSLLSRLNSQTLDSLRAPMSTEVEQLLNIFDKRWRSASKSDPTKPV